MTAASRTQFDIFARMRRAAKAAAKGNLAANAVSSAAATITAPTSKPSTTGFTNILAGGSQGWAASFTGTTTNGSTVITSVSSTAGLVVGMPLVVNNASGAPYPSTIPLGSVITAINAAGSAVTMSKPAGADGSAITIRAQSIQFKMRGGVPISYGNNFTGGGATVGNSVTPPTGQVCNQNGYAIEFMTDAGNISTAAVTLMAYIYQVGGKFRVAIDDVYQSADPIAFDTTGRTVAIQLATAGIHKIRIECSAGLSFLELWVANGASIWAPESSDDVLVGWFSDSWGQGGASGSWPMRNMAQICGHLLGWQVDCLSVGGTGYRADGSSNYNWQSSYRVRDVLLRPYDALVLFGSINDNGATSAQEQAAALATWQSIRALYPANPIFVLGVPTTTSVSASAAGTLETGLAAAFTQWGDANSVYIPVTGAPDGAWLSTGNAGTYIAGDGSHPTDIAGASYVGYRAASAIARAIDAAGELLSA